MSVRDIDLEVSFLVMSLSLVSYWSYLLSWEVFPPPLFLTCVFGGWVLFILLKSDRTHLSFVCVGAGGVKE